MKKKSFVPTVLAVACLVVLLLQGRDINNESSIFLENLEALASGEDEDGSAEKEEFTRQVGPFTGEEGNLFYWICTETLCYDNGIIDCNFGYICNERVSI